MRTFKNKESLIFVCIVFIGTLLRLYKLDQIPFTHDEFSALIRTEFESFSDLIAFGIIPDSHPAGIQILLYTLTSLFGTGEVVIKMPFILMGIGSIVLVYWLGKKLFSNSTGLIVATFMATLEYTIMYSQIARPYISGMFFCLLLVFYWIRIIQKGKPEKWFSHVGYVMAFSLCLYNHYFSGLFAILVFCSGLLWVRGRTLYYYLIASLIAGLSFIPHLKISLGHLEAGGLGSWLGPPKPDFLLDYFKYSFHYSIPLGVIIIGILLYGLVRFNKPRNPHMALTFISWFLLSYLIGFLYSIKIDPVLQFSVLIFSFPFLLIGIFALIDLKEWWKNLILVVVLLAITIPSLIHRRGYYNIFFKSRYYEIPAQFDHLTSHIHRDSVTWLMAMDPKLMNYSLRIQNKALPDHHFWMDSTLSGKHLVEFLDGLETPYLGYASESFAPNENVAMIQDHFGPLTKVSNYFLGSFFVFSKKAHTSVLDTLYYARNNFEKLDPCWEAGNPVYLTDSIQRSGMYSYKYSSEEAFGPAFSISLSDFPKISNTMLDIKLSFRPEDNFKDAVLVFSLEKKGKVEVWQGKSLNSFLSLDKKWNTAYLSINFSDISPLSKEQVIKVYVWNNQGQTFLIDDFELVLREGNPYLYGLFNPLPLK